MSDERRFYDDVDMRNTYNAGFWVGSVAGVIGMFILCVALGLFFVP